MQWERFSYQYWNISCCGCNNNPFLMGDAWICRIWTYFLTSNLCGRAWNFLLEEIYRFNFVQPFANILTKPHNHWTRQTVTGYIRNIAAGFFPGYIQLSHLWWMSNSVRTRLCDRDSRFQFFLFLFLLWDATQSKNLVSVPSLCMSGTWFRFRF